MTSFGTARAGSPAALGRRRFLAALGAGAAGLAAAGCARGSSTAAVPGTASISTDNGTWDEGYRKAGRALKPLTGYGLRPLSNPSATSYKQVTQMTLQTSRASDMLKWASGYELKSLARGGELSDLSRLWDRYEKKGWARPSQRASLSYRGKVYGIPLYESYYVVFYNKRVFARLELRPPATWDELLHCATVLKRNRITPFVATQNGSWPAYEWFQELVSKIDPDFYSALVGGRARYTDGVARQALDIWQGFIRKGWMTPPDFDQNNGAAALKGGRTGMFLHGTWQAQSLTGAGMRPGRDYDAFILPTVGKSTRKSVITESGVLAVPRSATTREAGMANVGAWLAPPVQRAWTDFLQDGSANPVVRPGNPVVAQLKETIARERVTRLIRYGEASPPNLVQGNTQDLAGFMTEQSSADATLRSMEARAADEWATWKRDEA
ncbi:ABC transporter substrate-binding protein [Streptomyces iconiensis]|uniref:Extracellular solute-binding protein n=1 Tax=Streptomyces iconiensis TaxID=1384038 RepID=A0ABT7A022_9ACTN|nr:extracellular solute-binding protein [Streptomyces iconiensis]MDJ1134675.1 extracellular solute-binding protein [Streptomyces iconiensis]